MRTQKEKAQDTQGVQPGVPVTATTVTPNPGFSGISKEGADYGSTGTNAVTMQEYDFNSNNARRLSMDSDPPSTQRRMSFDQTMNPAFRKRLGSTASQVDMNTGKEARASLRLRVLMFVFGMSNLYLRCRCG